MPAAPVPLCPSSSTTRVEATLSDSLSRVAISSTVGKAAKSSGREAYTAASSTIMASAMLKVNARSSSIGGSGIIIMLNMSSSNSGVPRPMSIEKLNRRPTTTSFICGRSRLRV